MCDQSKCTVTRVTTEYSRLPRLQRIVHFQAVSELTLLGRPRGLSDLVKLLDYMSRYPKPGPLLTPIFPSVTHLTTGIFPMVYRLEVREPPFYLFNDRILNKYVIDCRNLMDGSIACSLPGFHSRSSNYDVKNVQPILWRNNHQSL
jgi:hypothetical protein